MKDTRIPIIFERFAQQNPSPVTELQYTNHYTLLVAVVLSAQATDVGVNKATRALFERVATPQDMLDLGEEALLHHIRTIGLFRSKARHVMALSRILVEQYAGDIPHDRALLEALPGVGQKTAAVVLNVAFGEPTLAVDTHVFRVANRLGLVRTKTPAATEKPLLKKIPQPFRQHAHHWLILHGRYICKARKPLCSKCFLYDLCPSAER
jgi:endonuclease III